MGLITAKCTQCGANIEVDNTKEAGICSHCGTAFITEKVINNYNSFLTQNITKNIYGKEMPEVDDYINRAEAFIKMEDYKNANAQIDKAITVAPHNWKVWYVKIKNTTKNLTDIRAYNKYLLYLKKAKAIATESDFFELKKLCAAYENMFAKYSAQKEIIKTNLKAVLKARLKEQKLGFFLFLLIISLGGVLVWLGFQIFLYFPEYGFHWGYSNQHGIFHFVWCIVSAVAISSVGIYAIVKKRYGKGIVLLLMLLAIIGILNVVAVMTFI